MIYFSSPKRILMDDRFVAETVELNGEIAIRIPKDIVEYNKIKAGRKIRTRFREDGCGELFGLTKPKMTGRQFKDLVGR